MSKELEQDLSLRKLRLNENLNEDVFKKYQVIKTIDTGSMGSISIVKLKNAKDKFYAVKMIRIERITKKRIEALKNEIRIIRYLDHPNIARAYELYNNDNKYMSPIYLVMEYLSGGDLNTRKPYSEKDAKRIIKQLLYAVKYMHEHGIVHRDLKLENVLFKHDGPDAVIKVIDFGLSVKYKDDGDPLKRIVGTIATMAPQVLERCYSSQCDLWSVGVIAYEMLSGRNPFFDIEDETVTVKQVIGKIMICEYDFKGESWKEKTKESKEFISSLIMYDREERLNAAEALQHKWLSNLKKHNISTEELENVKDSFTSYANYSEIKKIALLFIAHQADLATDKMVTLRKIFEHYDVEMTGTISFAEFNEGMRSYGFSDDEIKDMFSSVDTYHDRKISYTEFLAATIEGNLDIRQERIIDTFKKIDCDNTGYICRDNLKSLLGSDYTVERANTIFEELNLSSTEKISLKDFLKPFRKDLKLSMIDKIVINIFGK